MTEPFRPSVDLSRDVRLWLVRHGETEWSRSGQHTGRTDIPLTPVGERQARALRGIVPAAPAFVMSSPRQRARNTATLAGLTADVITEDLAEWDYGEYEGLTTPQIRERVPGWTVFTAPTPGGETPEQITERADRVLRVACDHLADGPVVLVAHGHICRVLGARWIGMRAVDASHLILDTAAPSVLGAEHGVPALRHWNMPNPVSG